jgi:CheY-like chemotaxis protein
MIKIMIVEDDRSLREIYSVRLAAEGYSIVSAGDGEEALGVVIREKPDLIISDVMMPKISGFDMLDILRSTPETKDVKVIMMTALSSVDQKERGEKLGADRYLVKSQVGIEDVVRAVHEVLGDTPSNDAAGNIAVASSIVSGPEEPSLPAFEPTTVSAEPVAPASSPLPPVEPVAPVPLPPLEPPAPVPAPEPAPAPAVAAPPAPEVTTNEEPLSPAAEAILNAPITPMPSAAIAEPPAPDVEPISAEPVAEPAPVAPPPAVPAPTEPIVVPEPVAPPAEPAPAPATDAEPAFPFPTLPDPTIAPNIDGSERSETVVPVSATPSQSDMEAQIASELGAK